MTFRNPLRIFASASKLMAMKNLDETIIRRYVDILSDAGFKAVFGGGRNKDVLADMLNVLLPAHRKVGDLTYMTTELPQFSPFGKSVRLDLRCRGEDGSVFIVEVQNYAQRNFFRRSVLYAAKSYDAGARAGNGGVYDIPPVYFIGLLSGERQGFELDDPERFISEYAFREKVTGKVPDETINFVFLELNRFGRKLEECEGLVEQWCYALKHIGTLDRLPEELRTKAFERLFRACEVAKFSPEVKLKYESDMITERDYYNIIGTAEERGEARGRESGKAEVARKMLSAGMPESQITAFTGLTKEQLENLK